MQFPCPAEGHNDILRDAEKGKGNVATGKGRVADKGKVTSLQPTQNKARGRVEIRAPTSIGSVQRQLFCPLFTVVSFIPGGDSLKLGGEGGMIPRTGGGIPMSQTPTHRGNLFLVDTISMPPLVVHGGAGDIVRIVRIVMPRGICYPLMS